MSDAVDLYVKTHSKSQGAGFLLTFLFGPLGLFYSSWVAALILLVVAISTAATIIGPVVCWVLAILVSFPAVSKYNQKVMASAALLSRQ